MRQGLAGFGLSSARLFVLKLSDEERNALDLWQSLTPELRKVAQRLPNLPEAIKAGIVAMVKAAEKER